MRGKSGELYFYSEKTVILKKNQGKLTISDYCDLSVVSPINSRKDSYTERLEAATIYDI